MTHTADRSNPMTPELAKAFRRRLLAWYRKHRRDLPWREMNGRPVNPYHVLLSEAMLQQTQVATVVPYFHRFIEALPSVHALAEADEQQVLTLWQGLGYYRRARNLHAAARKIVEEFDGEVPATVIDLLQIPGVGRYTAGAIASIAHGTQAAIVDGNVERVFARLMLIEDPINAPATNKQVWSIAEDLVPRSSPGDYNQALMELGATICTPKLPQCFVCPVREHCRGVQETNPELLPIKLAKKKPKEVTHIVIAAERNGKYLFEQRPSDGLWSNMWQLPTWEEPSGQPTGRNLAELFNDRFGLVLEQLDQATDFKHQTTHRTIRFVVYNASVIDGRLKAKAGVWHRLDTLSNTPLSNPQKKIVTHLA
ncbi:MAG: A/G-specific adenine glycosylase [Planctomycetota bacterium]